VSAGTRSALRLLPGRSRWSDERELAHAIHGTVVGAAVMAASSAHGGTLGQVVVSVLGTLTVYWIAERYSGILAAGVQGSKLTWVGVRRSLRQGWPMVQASVAPLLVLLGATVLTPGLQGAVMIALAFATAQLAGLGWLAGRRAGGSRRAAAAWAAASGVLGLLTMGLKLLLH
jgi:hypothetical protein